MGVMYDFEPYMRDVLAGWPRYSRTRLCATVLYWNASVRGCVGAVPVGTRHQMGLSG